VLVSWIQFLWGNSWHCDEEPWEEGEDADDMWLKMATCVQKVASEVFGRQTGSERHMVVE
jgi:hypothetical protein